MADTSTIEQMATKEVAQTWLPSDVGSLVLKPVSTGSIAILAAGFKTAKKQTNNYRVPIVRTDPQAEWVAEGAEIVPSKGQFGEVVDSFHKLAGLTIISRELAEDSNPGALDHVADGLGRDIAKKLDMAIFGKRGSDLIPPLGLLDITDVNQIAAGTSWSDLDPFVHAVYEAEQQGAQLNAFVTNPADAYALATLKDANGSNRTLLGSDPTRPDLRMISGVPLLASSAVEPGTVWGIPKDNLLTIVIRQDVQVEADKSVYFTSDLIAVKATMRVAILHPHPEAIQKIHLQP